MALTTRTAILSTFNPLYQVKRFRGKINIQRPKPPHFERAKYIELCKPYFINPKKDKKPFELCTGPGVRIVNKDEDNPFQRILAGELRQCFFTSRLIGLYHENTIKADQLFNAQVLLKRENMYYKRYGKKTLEIALTGTPYETIMDYYISRNMLIFSAEPEIKKMMKVTKKFPQLILLAGIYEGKFVSKDELTRLSLIPNLQTAQTNLVQTLNSIGLHLVSQLNSHQTSLVSNLEERRKQLEEVKE